MYHKRKSYWIVYRRIEQFIETRVCNRDNKRRKETLYDKKKEK